MYVHIATRQDNQAIVALAVAFRDHLDRSSPSQAQFKESIRQLLVSPDAEFFIATIEGRPTGYLLQRYRHSMWANGAEATIEDLFVDPCARKNGTGAALVQFALARAAELRCTSVCLDTNEFNAASTKIYSRLGFTSFSKRWNGRQVFFRKAIEPHA